VVLVEELDELPLLWLAEALDEVQSDGFRSALQHARVEQGHLALGRV
jgi:hypothetical protein